LPASLAEQRVARQILTGVLAGQAELLEDLRAS